MSPSSATSTGERAAQYALRGSEGRMKAILAAALDAIVAMDHRGLVTALNPAAEKLFGYTAAEAVGRTVAELFIPEAQRKAHRLGLERLPPPPASGRWWAGASRSGRGAPTAANFPPRSPYCASMRRTAE